MSQDKETALRLLPDGYHAHDLLWVKPRASFKTQDLPTWVGASWTVEVPVVVRRDFSEAGLIPVGIRGTTRAERFATWIDPQDVARCLSPEDIVTGVRQMVHLPFDGMKPVQALRRLLEAPWAKAFDWGVTGSCAFALATGIPVMHDDSDLDLLVRCPEPLPKAAFRSVTESITKLPCRADIQVETPLGAFSLKEWLREETGRVLLKTNTGPVLTAAPWGEVGVSDG